LTENSLQSADKLRPTRKPCCGRETARCCCKIRYCHHHHHHQL